MTDQHLSMDFPFCISLNPSLRILLAIFSSGKGAYPLLSGLCDVLVGLEETADVQGLAAPDVAVDGPVEGELQGAAVERAGHRVRGMSHVRALGWLLLLLTGSGVW